MKTVEVGPLLIVLLIRNQSPTGYAFDIGLEAEEMIGGVGFDLGLIGCRQQSEDDVESAIGEVELAVGTEADAVGPAYPLITDQGLQRTIGSQPGQAAVLDVCSLGAAGRSKSSRRLIKGTVCPRTSRTSPVPASAQASPSST